MSNETYWKLAVVLPNEETEEIVNDFLLNMKIKNHSKGSIIVYRRFLTHFFSDFTESYKNISSEEIWEWYQRKQNHVKETTLSLRLSILSSFYVFCIQEDYIESSPMKFRWFPRLPQPVPRYLTNGEEAKVRHGIENFSLRERTLFEFILSSGCRVGEVSSLNREDIDLESRTAKVTGKGKKIRFVHFSEKAALLLEKYLEATKNISPQSLFVTSTGKRLGIRAIQTNMKTVGDTIGTRVYPHRLRHTFATNLLAKGAEISFISEELGHSDLSTTQIYARLPDKSIISLYKKYMG
ncbi:tyrosine-type recombinase/integrase [Mangrovibacillus cuniculi]|uniref:Tyrosine-type recombinase/integrase n=1 Tax=Mangrovibacillus cuniculi TaxID=2593652 RepID=A0A7S8HG63_9BACI|nr:tyrosine-type recombinase/integrase [Mangrovibacillus cuniculi]QPC47558.1 tyrosine-type recombinase/integrase [Mangrovibacillus cuniculi]